ncbi:antibiotic biosynthesis monooxygenase [Merismopedia glauca CCAP 1448/3]|uniref:Antibiotic biosynthesis monooxygenase n=1 Tax=Merismopedia glauca CCAP 1448/3 TaxID=1296344 RepID=A0A2T1C3Y7_9CYAN|nr:antibiotic biosynthesis monooxygenase [Merismopedia glauca CCAP 1448/3]
MLEVAILDIKPGLAAEFESAFKTASIIIAAMPGYKSHELQRCMETANRYILLVNWEDLENHTVGFRQSPEYQEWRSLLHHFYEPFPIVEHYEVVLRNNQSHRDLVGWVDDRKSNFE